MAAKFKMVHVSTIRGGDTIEFDGQMRTVCDKDIKTGGLLGTSIFGDSFRGGHTKVKKFIFPAFKNGVQL